MTVDEHYKVLSSALNENVYVNVCNHLKGCAKERKRVLLRELVYYISSFSESLNTSDKELTYYNLAHIRTHLCKRFNFNSAKQYFLYMLHLIEDLANNGIFSSYLTLPERILSTASYEAYKESNIPEAILDKFDVPLSKQEAFEETVNNTCTSKVAAGFRDYVSNLKTKIRSRHIDPIESFLTTIFNEDTEWHNKPSVINKVLVDYNTQLNQHSVNIRPTSRSTYLNLVNSLSYLINKEILPINTTLPEYQARKPKNSRISSQPDKDKIRNALNISLSKVSTFVSQSIYEGIKEYLKSLNVNYRIKQELANDLNTYTVLFCKIFSKSVNEGTEKELEYILIKICQNYVFDGANRRCNQILGLIQYLVVENIISEPTKIPISAICKVEYNRLKTLKIPNDINEQISIKTAEELFEDTLKNNCSEDIAKRLIQHVNSFKKRDRKSHRKPIFDFVIQISKIEKQWFNYPNTIQGELLNFRDNQLKTLNRNTAYKNFQILKNAITVLIEHGLISKETNLPDNLRKSSNVSTSRKTNPLILQIDLYDKTKQKGYIDSPTFLEDVRKELFQNLNELVKTSQEIIAKGYAKFLECEDMILKSQREEFVLDPNLLVQKSTTSKSNSKVNKVNPFDTLHPLNKENRIAYYDLYFDQLINNNKPHNSTNLKFGREITEYFGLTPLMSSAMHIIISEELGFNPHPLYQAKISSDKRGAEYVHINDDGNVRIKVIKPRARKVHKATAKGSLVTLKKLNSKDINAAACLKIAIEMGERSRASLQSDYLWVNLMIGGVASLPDSSTFQKHFNFIRKLAFNNSKSPALESATLKSVRCSKGVLIYLESNGDIVKTSNYYGNQAKTALHSYIPEYLAELIYRVKIRAFQNILLYMTISSDEAPHSILNLQENDFKDLLKSAFSNPDMGGSFYNKLTKATPDNQNEDTKYFCVSKENIRIAIKYAKEGTDIELKKDCETVLRKLSEGPVIMKQMLRDSLRDYKGS